MDQEQVLSYEKQGSGETTLFLLHFLGGSAREWQAVSSILETEFLCVAMDLAGFGNSRDVAGYSVSAMADAVSGVIASQARGRWLLAGHSMGAKVATAIARMAGDGVPNLDGLSGLILLAGSPPSPEPIADDRRKEMESWFGGSKAESRKQAEKFVTTNLGRGIPPEVHESAVEDVLRMNRAAWLAWLESGSREDWSDRIGTLRTPALVLAGEKDPDLGPDAQKKLMLPHFHSAQLEVLPGARHLLPMECAPEVAALISPFAQKENAPSPRRRDRNFFAGELLNSDQVSAATRAVLNQRAQADGTAYAPQALTRDELDLLRLVIAHLVPNESAHGMDVAARMDRQLAQSDGDGWRYAALPADTQAYRAGLRTLDQQARAEFGASFAEITPRRQADLLQRAAQGGPAVEQDGDAMHRRQTHVVSEGHLFSAEQMRFWMQDLRADAVGVFVSHPATLAAMDYHGFADGGQ